MNSREIIAERYPLHYQRIVEVIYAHPEDRDPEVCLAEDGHWFHTMGLFIWDRTTEGHEYWSRLFGHWRGKG